MDPLETLVIRPLGLGPRAPLEAAGGLALAGGPLAFLAVEAVFRAGGRTRTKHILPLGEFQAWARGEGPQRRRQVEERLDLLSAPRAPFAGLEMPGPHIMAIVNVTPDSFSDGGKRLNPARAVADALAFREAGAAIIDVGGESTRPGAAPLAPGEELARVQPVVADLADAGGLVSIDSRNAEVMASALAAGARIVNDVSALTHDAGSLTLVAESEASIVLMHMQGTPSTMQQEPYYDDVALEVFEYLAGRLAACLEAGIPRRRIALDPGFGFGKSVAHNLEILERLALFHGLGCPLLVGLSRKSTIARLSRGEPPGKRLPGSLAAGLAAVAAGAQILRVHDVSETAQALAIWSAIGTAATL